MGGRYADFADLLAGRRERLPNLRWIHAYTSLPADLRRGDRAAHRLFQSARGAERCDGPFVGSSRPAERSGG
ncbi:hypothetical protein [Streptomyces rochei]|uniref:hypothetical protein n=1 Tax=Streptomyces rochei TaxID=1928 RepID=UPI0033C6A19F